MEGELDGRDLCRDPLDVGSKSGDPMLIFVSVSRKDKSERDGGDLCRVSLDCRVFVSLPT